MEVRESLALKTLETSTGVELPPGLTVPDIPLVFPAGTFGITTPRHAARLLAPDGWKHGPGNHALIRPPKSRISPA